MSQRTLTSPEDLRKAAATLVTLGANLPMVMTLTEGSKIRSDSQNARHWASLHDWREQIENAVALISIETGYTNLEVRRLVADQLPHEQAAILYVRRDDSVHDILKQCAGIPTSTRLGTKAFNMFDEERDRIMAEILGEVHAVQMKAGA